mmetsp:Transcript_19090/g.37703  ORF Transcript_19090/g.37703 Transcript_19090/m.37703 type:complete len:88 (+) Transcript_19090:429-692(+)
MQRGSLKSCQRPFSFGWPRLPIFVKEEQLAVCKFTNRTRMATCLIMMPIKTMHLACLKHTPLYTAKELGSTMRAFSGSVNRIKEVFV